jgi:uncharacterized protein (UPF0332 family)
LALAKHLDGCPKPVPVETSIRGACGRAYYAAFGVARDVLLAVPFTMSQSGDDHRRIVQLMKNSTDVEVATAGSLLDSLRTTRNSADYEVGRVPVRGTPFTSKRSQVALLQAHGIIAALEGAARNDNRLSIPAAIT